MMKGKNGHVNGDKGEIMTSLLDSTDSDVEWLNLPPIKGKKLKKKKSSGKPRDTSLCDTWVLLKVFLCASLVGAVVLLSVTTIWLSTQLNIVRQQLKQVESKSTVNSEDVMKLQSFVMHINKSLELETKTSQQLLENITAINGTITKLSNSVKKVSAAVEAAPEIKQIPEKLKIVSTTLAQMGSDVSSLKEKVETVDPFHKSTTAKLDNITKQIEEIKQAAMSEAESKESLNPDLANLVQLIPQRLEDLNSTVSGQISVIMKSLSAYEERFLKLENISHSLKSSWKGSQGGDRSEGPESDYWTSDQFKTAVTDILQDMLSKMSSKNGSQALPVLLQYREIAGNITDLRQRLSNMEKLQSEGSEQTKGLSQESLDGLKDTLQGQLKAMNESITDVQMNQAHVASLVLNHSNMLNNITHQITVMQHYVSYLEQTLRQIHTPNITQTTEETPTTNLSGTSTKSSHSTGTEKPKTVTNSIEVEKTTATIVPALIIPSIKNTEDLEDGFNHWSRGHSVEQVRYEDLRGFLGPNTPKKEDLNKFDEDKSGSYSLKEFSKALGIPLDEDAESDLPKITTPTDNIPPR